MWCFTGICVMADSSCYTIYINDLGNFCDSTLRLFADDTSVIAKETSPAQLKQQLNYELKHIAAWINANNLTISPTKTYDFVISPFTKLNFPLFMYSTTTI